MGRNRLSQQRQESDKTYRLYLDGALTVPEFKERFQPLDARKQEIEKEISNLEAEADLLKVERLSTEQIMSEARDLAARWPNMPPASRRNIVEMLVKDITVGQGEISLNLYYAPSLERNDN